VVALAVDLEHGLQGGRLTAQSGCVKSGMIRGTAYRCSQVSKLG
jgi:hypothetical protein